MVFVLKKSLHISKSIWLRFKLFKNISPSFWVFAIKIYPRNFWQKPFLVNFYKNMVQNCQFPIDRKQSNGDPLGIERNFKFSFFIRNYIHFITTCFAHNGMASNTIRKRALNGVKFAFFATISIPNPIRVNGILDIQCFIGK